MLETLINRAFQSLDYKNSENQNHFEILILLTKLQGGKEKMTLSSTVEMMCSDDYKERFRAEYAQLVNRYYGLRRMLEKWDNGTLEFEPTCPRSTYNMQTKAMEDYIAVLEARAVMEDVNLEDVII